MLDEMAARARTASDIAGTEVAPLWADLVSARQRLANLVVRGPGDDRTDKYQALVEDARREKELAERALAARSADFRNELARAEIGLDEVRAALPPRSALVSFASYDRTLAGSPPSIASQTSPAKFQPLRKVRSYIAFVITAAQPGISVVPLGSAAGVNDLVARWHEAATDIERIRTGAGAEEAYRVAGTALRRRVWDPVARHLTGVATVFVVPDGTLNLVSLAALPIGQQVTCSIKGQSFITFGGAIWSRTRRHAPTWACWPWRCGVRRCDRVRGSGKVQRHCPHPPAEPLTPEFAADAMTSAR